MRASGKPTKRGREACSFLLVIHLQCSPAGSRMLCARSVGFASALQSNPCIPKSALRPTDHVLLGNTEWNHQRLAVHTNLAGAVSHGALLPLDPGWRKGKHPHVHHIPPPCGTGCYFVLVME